MENLEPSCPDCGSSDLTAIVVSVVQETHRALPLYRDDRGNVYADPDTPDPETENLDTDRDGTRYVCGECGYEGEPEDWSPEDNPDHPDHAEPLEDDSFHCPGCGGETATYLGRLGSTTHVRCRDCGLDSSLWQPS